MTTPTLDDAETRQELEKFFAFLVAYSASKDADEGVVRTLKAGSFLLIYNFVEASMRRGVEAIFAALDSKRVSFDDLRSELKRIVFLNHANIPIEFCEKATSIAHDYVNAGFKSRKLFAGNLDAKKIRDVAKKYGFSPHTDNATTRGGARLETVKNMRNDLAHGVKTFREVGRDYSPEELERLKTEVVSYVSSILANIDSFIVKQEYLRNAP